MAKSKKMSNNKVAQLLAIQYATKYYMDEKSSINNPDKFIGRYNVAYGTFLASLDHSDKLSKKRSRMLDKRANDHHQN